MEGGFYTPREVARILKVSERTVRRWVRRGELKGLRFGRQLRIPVGALAGLGQPATTDDDWLARCREVRMAMPPSDDTVELLRQMRRERAQE